MRLPVTTAGRLDAVLNTGQASAGSTYVNGFAISSAGKVQVDNSAISGVVFYNGGIARKPTGVIWVTESAPTRHVGGIPVADSGAVSVADANPTAWVAGLPLADGISIASGVLSTITPGTISVSGTTITIPATLTVDNSGGVYGVEYTILDNGGSLTGYTLAKNTVGAGVGANTIDLVAADGVTSDSTVTIRSYYNLDPLDLDPADRVYAGDYVPFVVAAGAPTGTTSVGSTLTRAAQGVIAGSSPITIVRQWQNDQNTGTWINLTGETASTYVLVSGDTGDDIAVLDTATNSAGSDSERSTAVGPISSGVTVTDTFTEGSNSALGSHTSDSGDTWTVTLGGITVIAAVDAVQEQASGAGNRARCDKNMGSDQMDVQADFTLLGAGTLCAWGPAGRFGAADVAGAYEFLYDVSVGGYTLNGATDVIEAWPGGTVTMKLEIRNGTVTGYVNGVSKIVSSTTLGAGKNYAGISLINFSGGAVDQIRGDNYSAVSA